MKVLEISTLQTGMDTVEKDLDVQKQQLQQIEQSIQAFVDLRDSFKGLGGQSIRQFFESYHLSFLKQLFSFYEEYKETLSQIRTNLQILEPDSNGYIKERFLEYEVADGLKTIKEKTIFLTEEANDIMSSVSDIVSLPKLDDSYVLQGVANTEEKRDITVGQLHTFDQQQTAALESLEYTVHAMIEYIQLGSALFQSKSGSIQTVESIFYNQSVYQPSLPLYTYSSATLNQLSTWDNFYLNYVKSNLTSKVESLISAREAEALMRHAKDSVEVIDEYNGINEVSAISGHYYTLGDGKILRQYYDATGAYKYEYVESIPEDQTGEAKEVGSEVVSFILDFIPILSNVKAAIEAFSGEDLITGREIGDVERAVLVAAILGGPIVKGARVIGKAAMKQLPTVKNVLHPEKVKSFAKGFYDDYIQKGTSVFKDLVKKVADIPLPTSPSLVATNGMAFTKTIGETMREAKETIVQMAEKVKDRVSGKDVYGSYYDEAKKLHKNNPDWYPDPDESTIVKGKELKEARADYQSLVRRGELEKGHHKQGLAFGGENINSNIKKTGESTIHRQQFDDLNLDFYHEMGYGKKNAKVLKIHENEEGIILFGNNPKHTEVTNFQNKVLKWQRESGKR